jgi:uncharacterized protein (TIGR02646 family)
MIRIRKPRKPPAKLTNEGSKRAQQHQQEYDDNPGGFERGDAKFTFSSSIYNDPTVKAALVEAQHKKCCFCERLIGDDGDVEHFRPKSAYRQQSGDALIRPGYYWLAYEWTNLYLSCSACNQRHKGNLFPLNDASQRAHKFQNSTASEEPLFINPGQENPGKYISFRGEIAYSIRGNVKGTVTIEQLGLNREILNDVRLRHLQTLKVLEDIQQLAQKQPSNQELQEQAQKAANFLRSAILDPGEFAAATRQAIKTDFQEILDS